MELVIELYETLNGKNKLRFIDYLLALSNEDSGSLPPVFLGKECDKEQVERQTSSADLLHRNP